MHGRICIANEKEFRNTNATIAQVTEAFHMLVLEIGTETPAVANARRVVALLGHTLPRDERPEQPHDGSDLASYELDE